LAWAAFLAQLITAIVRLLSGTAMSSGEQVLQKKSSIYFPQNRRYSMLCRPLQAVRVDGDSSAWQRLANV